MKRELAKHEQSAIRNLAADFCRRIDTKGPYEDGLITGSADGYRAGYTACAESSVPIELFREVVEALTDAMEYLPDLKSEWVWKQNTIPKNDREYSELSTCISSAQEVLNKAKSYLP